MCPTHTGLNTSLATVARATWHTRNYLQLLILLFKEIPAKIRLLGCVCGFLKLGSSLVCRLRGGYGTPVGKVAA